MAKSSDDLTGLMVHAYNNHLAAMAGFTELALLECEQPAVKEKLELSMNSALAAASLGKQLLSAISRLQVIFQTNQLETLLKKFSSATLIFQSDSVKQLSICTDEEWFRYCLGLISDFCLKWDGSEQNKLTLHINAIPDKRVQLIINIAELSLTPEQQSCLFQPFYSGRLINQPKEVGLAVVDGFIRQMKGTLSWNTDQGFVIELPAE